MTENSELTTNNSKIPCPVCESKRELAAMEMTPETIAEMAAAEPCADYCGDELYTRRLEICRDCPKLLGGMTCGNCGCFVQFRAKHITAHCSDGKW